MEMIDAYLFRYGSLASNLQDAVFKSIGEIEQEPVSTMSNRDRTVLMERVGALPSADDFSLVSIIRNRLMHEYPEETKKQIDRINFVMDESPQLVEIFLGVARYAEKFGIQISIDNFRHLASIKRGFVRQ
jgi:hypothetical protein